ncbi:HET domain-containing protein [Fusarium sp. LHS14.1]|nr:HET domain-containing protein [Fusarium sp. LHS14.1]
MSEQTQDPGPTVASPAAVQLYDSLPIPPDSQFVRVLDISAKSSTINEGLTGSLRIVDLRDSPKFTALSYVWGNASGKSINCNGYEVNITDSCFEALYSLRKTLGGLTVWADAICINQADKDEKSAQLPLMELIYTWAEAVYIWLEPGNENIKEALEYMRLVSQHHLFSVGVPWRSEKRTMTTFEEKIRFYASALTMSSFKEYINEDSWFPIERPVPERPKYECTAFLELIDKD